jgi:hypothetical protein
VRANQRALQTIVEQPRLAVDYIASFLGRLTSEETRQHLDLNVAQRAVDAVATELGIPAATIAATTVDQMYLPAL